MPTYERECKDCGCVHEVISPVDGRCSLPCPSCCSENIKILISPPGAIVKFPEGVFHSLPDEPYITSMNQLREEVKKSEKDEFTEHYAKYDDGYRRG